MISFLSRRQTNGMQSGKIIRRLLRDRAKEEVGDKDPPKARL